MPKVAIELKFGNCGKSNGLEIKSVIDLVFTRNLKSIKLIHTAKNHCAYLKDIYKNIHNSKTLKYVEFDQCDLPKMQIACIKGNMSIRQVCIITNCDINWEQTNVIDFMKKHSNFRVIVEDRGGVLEYSNQLER